MALWQNLLASIEEHIHRWWVSQAISLGSSSITLISEGYHIGTYMGLINHMSHVKHNTWMLRTTGIYLAYYAYIGGPTLLQSCADRHTKIVTSASKCYHWVTVFPLLMIDCSWYYGVNLLSPVVKCTDLVPCGDCLWHILEITWNYIVLYCILCSFDSKQITSSYLPFFTEKTTPNEI